MVKYTRSPDKTSIPLSKNTRNRLGTFGNKNESWDKLINRILDEKETLFAKDNTYFKDVTEEIEKLNYPLQEAFDYALHFVTEDRNVSFKFSDIRVTIEGGE